MAKYRRLVIMKEKDNDADILRAKEDDLLYISNPHDEDLLDDVNMWPSDVFGRSKSIGLSLEYNWEIVQDVNGHPHLIGRNKEE